MCDVFDVGCQIEEAGQSVLGSIASAAGQAAGDMVVLSLSWWVLTPSLDPNIEPIRQLQSSTLPVSALILMVSFLVQTMRMVVSARKEPLLDIGTMLARYVLVSGAGLVALSGALQGGDALAAGLITQGMDTYGQRIGGLFVTTALSQPMATLLVSLLVFLLSVLQWVLGFVRIAGIAILAVLLPIAAAGPKQGLLRVLLWSGALVVYKYEAALIYDIGFTLLGTGQDFSTLMVGAMILVLSIIALPATMRFFSWAGMAVTSGSGGGNVLAVGASGAVALAGMGGRNPAVAGAQMMATSGPGTGPGGPSGATPGPGPAAPSGQGPAGGPTQPLGGGPSGAGSTATTAIAAMGGPVAVAATAATTVIGAANSVANSATTPVTPPPPATAPTVPAVPPGPSTAGGRA